MILPFIKLQKFGERLLIARGLRAADASYIAATAVMTQAGGLASHGVIQFHRLMRQPGVIDPKRRPVLDRNRGAVAVLNCEGCYSQAALRQALILGERKARKYGLGMVAVRNGSWLGGLGAHVLPLVQRGLMVQFWAQYSACRDSAPQGGIDARLSTNPVCLGFPAGAAGRLVLADFSTAAMSMGQTMQMVRANQRAAAPCFFDRKGRLTDDPNVVPAGGAIALMGGTANGFKGFAFALWAEALAAMAGGCTNNPRASQRQNFNLLVLDPAAFGDPEHYHREMRRLVRWVKTSRPQPGSDGVRLPGERFLAAIARARRRGVPVDDGLLELLNRQADQWGAPRLNACA